MKKIGIALGMFCVLMGFGQSLQPMHPAMNNWYFGNAPTAIRFNRVTGAAEKVSNMGVPFGAAGNATASDSNNGNLLFYTDGITIYDASHQPMVDGSGLLGNNTANQSAVVCPVPGQMGKYYVFANNGAVTYTVVDMSLIGNTIFPRLTELGAVELARKNLNVGIAGRSEAMLMLPHTNGTDFWLLTQVAGTNNYTATLVDANSYITGVFTSLPPVLAGSTLSASQLAYHFGTDLLAVAPTTANTNVQILNFNRGTGLLSFNTDVPNSAVAATNGQAIYDVEWSLNGDYLYYSVHGDEAVPVSGNVFQFDVANPAITLASVLPASVFRSYGLQLAPDSTIYHLYQASNGGPFLVGRLSDIDSVAANTVYETMPHGNNNWLARQFSATLPRSRPIVNISFTTAGTCQNAPTSFFPTVTPAADSLVWDFGDGGMATAWAPVYTYQNAGAFPVSVTAYLQGQVAGTAFGMANITAFQLTLTLPADTTACTFEFPPPKGTSGPPRFSVTVQVSGGTASTFAWSNGDTDATLEPDSAGYFYVVVTDGSGCSAYAGVNVKEYGVPDQRANVWYFGTNAGIDFNTTPATPLDNSIMNAPEGCSAVSDRNGDILFYTDGNAVYVVDRTSPLDPKPHLPLLLTGLGGDVESTQSALIVPVPGDETLYYIFTTEKNTDHPTYSIKYSLFDLKAGVPGIGALTQTGITLFNNSTERIAANQSWLIAHEFGNNTFRAYQITAQGIIGPVYSAIGSDHTTSVLENAEGYLKISNRNHVAVPLSSPGVSNFVELFDLVDTTGLLTNYRQIDLATPAGQAYGIEFSPGGNKMFVTVSGAGASNILEYSIDSLGVVEFKQKVANASELGAMQLGPDGQIYIAINGSNVLGTINSNEDKDQLSSFNFSGFTLAAGTTSQLGLPSFVQQTGSAFTGPGMALSGFCHPTPMDYSGTETDPIDVFLWAFGDGATDDQRSGTHTYGAPGTYVVSLNMTNRCGLDTTLIQNVTINPSPIAPTIPGSDFLCTGAKVLDANTGAVAGLTYLWSTTETTRQITVSAAGTYSVGITDANGCTSNGQTILTDARPVVELGPDLTLCQNQSVASLNAQNPTLQIVWSVDGAPNGNTNPLQPVSTATAGVDLYSVTVTDAISTCFTTDQVTYTINQSPGAIVTKTDVAGVCGTATGSIAINITTPATHNFDYQITGTIASGAFINSAFAQAIGNYVVPVAAGTFTVIVDDNISGCAISATRTVNDQTAPTVTAPNANTCTTATLAGTTNAIASGAANYTFRVFNSGGVQVGATSTNRVVDNFTTGILNPGNYTLQVRTNTGCIGTSATIQVIQDAQPVLTSVSDVCSSPATITVTSNVNAAFIWAVDGTITATNNTANTSTISIAPAANVAKTYTITATAACAQSLPVMVTVPASITPTITASDACQSTVTLTTTPAAGAGFTHRWYVDGAVSPALFGSPLSLTTVDDGKSYVLEVLSATSGCAYQSAPHVASVVGPVSVAIASTPACDDGSPFTITATTATVSPTVSWSFDNLPADGVFAPLTETSLVIGKTESGTYKVRVEKGICSAENQITLLLGPIPVGSMPNQVVICDDPENADPTTDHYDLNPGSFLAYDWFYQKTEDSAEGNLGFTGPVYTADKKGIYRVEITNSFGCVSSDITEVLNDCVPKIYVPNALKPTSTIALNRVFSALTFFVKDEDFKIFIYNRWGELVFQSEQRDFQWNGGYDNDPTRPLPSGAYSYNIQYISTFRPDEGVQEKRGGIVLLR